MNDLKTLAMIALLWSLVGGLFYFLFKDFEGIPGYQSDFNPGVCVPMTF